MDIYEVLSNDHRHFESLLDRLVAASEAGNDEWKSILDELRRGVIAHAHAEEALFYNALRETDASKSLVAHSYAEHAMSEGELRTLGVAKLIDTTWTALAKKLSHDLRHHIEEEESRVFDAARQVLTREEERQIGAAFAQMKKETAKDGDSLIASTVDLVANMLPPRLTDSFRKTIEQLRAG
ncbi:MAG: hemerythrin cation binding region [Myxococcaceae bacterium]|nr:hemerythrin cation binding region [Myxococcaceae bacterium]